MQRARRGVLHAALGAGAALLAGCAADAARIAREREYDAAIDRQAARVYKLPYDVVWGALMSSVAARKLTVLQADAVAGVMDLRNGVSATSAGERIDIRVTATAEQAVRVEIRSRPLVPVALPQDWQRLLFGDLEQKIAPRRPR